MTDNDHNDKTDNDHNEKTDWSDFDTAMEKREMGAEIPTAGPMSARELTASMQKPKGIIADFKANRIEKKAALEAMTVSYRAQLDVLKHTMTAAATVKKTEIDLYAEKFLRDLDARHLAALVEIGLRNKGTRESALVAATDQTVKTMREVMAKDWPQSFIDDTWDQLQKVRLRIIDEIMAELGSEHED